MRLFAKIFICAAFVLCVAILFSGYLLITLSYENAMERETERALNQYQYEKFSVQSAVLSNVESWRGGIPQNDATLGRLASDINGLAAFFREDKTLLYSAFPANTEFTLLDNITEYDIGYEYQNVGDSRYLMICSKLTQSDVSLYVLIATDVSQIIAQKNQMLDSFKYVYVLTVAASMVLILILSAFITRPIKRLTKAADRMARGHYNERIDVSGKDEISDLSQSFNLLAGAVEDKINELILNARQKEDFVASFAHELKTPLTSVIGYADMLYQKNLPPERAKSAAWYILNEGLRLEALSLKLMDLIILDKQNFVLEEMSASELLTDVKEGLAPVFEEKNVTPHLSADKAKINVEYDLFKTLLINLIDNAVKAGCKDVWILGKASGDVYRICVTDNGRGIPETELSRITEAFYMVDKSRSRKQHGAGLGLALAAKIAELHGSRLSFKSEIDKGTRVTIDLVCERGDIDE